MRKFLTLVFLAFTLASCAGNNAAKMVAKIRGDLKHKHGLKDGEVIAKFDLAGIKKEDKIFSCSYASSINDAALNSKFLSDFDKVYRHKNLIQENSRKKIGMLSSLMLKLNSEYKVLAPSLVTKLRQTIIEYKQNIRAKPSKEDFFTKLVNIHNRTKNLPLFSPMEDAKITSKFGSRRHPSKNKIIHHCGLDMAARKGAKIFSAADGIVEEVSRSKTYGNSVLIKHTKEIKTRYAHLSKFNIREGDKVIIGQNLGAQGCSGTATGHHLHFEVIIRGKPVDPLAFISHSL